MYHIHNKRMMLIISGLVLIIVVFIGLALVFSRIGQEVEIAPGSEVPVASERDRLIEASSARESYSVEDPEVIDLIRGTSAPGTSVGSGDRDALIRATSGE